MWLGSGVAVAEVLADSYSSDSTPSLGTSICRECSPKKTKDKNNDNNKKNPRKYQILNGFEGSHLVTPTQSRTVY